MKQMTETAMVARMTSKGWNAEDAKRIIHEADTMSVQARASHLHYYGAITTFIAEQMTEVSA